jgi:two-component system response regulator PilR (NtrC family)
LDDGSDPVATAEASPNKTPATGDLQVYLDQLERDLLIHALQENDFNRSAAAASLGLNLRQLGRRMARLAIAAPKDKDGPADPG